jgi:ferrous iron transport protein A
MQVAPPPSGANQRFRRMPLSDLPRGGRARIGALDGDSGLCARLREIGFCETAIIERIAGTDTVLCRTQVALSSQAARCILVDPIAA